MQYVCHYASPIGNLLLASDGACLTGLWFEGQKHYGLHLDKHAEEKPLPVFDCAMCWLDMYFAGKSPVSKVPVRLNGTAFQNDVWRILSTISYGQTVTYGDIAKQLAAQRELARMSAQAVGGAVGHNPISILIPCHRVIGANGSLTGYAGGIEKKLALLALEKIDTQRFFVPSNSTTP